jgi:maltose-binding protein MalE
MKKVLISILTVSFLIAGCDRSPTGNDSKTKDDRERGNMSLNNSDTIQQRDHYYTFSGTFEERKSAFKNAAAQLEKDVNTLATRATNDDEREYLEDVREKIAEAREICRSG